MVLGEEACWKRPKEPAPYYQWVEKKKHILARHQVLAAF